MKRHAVPIISAILLLALPMEYDALMPRQQNHLYLRLIEKDEPVDLVDRLHRVARAVESLPEVRLLCPPRPHPRGGFEIHLDLPQACDRVQLGIKLNEMGYLSVF